MDDCEGRIDVDEKDLQAIDKAVWYRSCEKVPIVKPSALSFCVRSYCTLYSFDILDRSVTYLLHNGGSPDGEMAKIKNLASKCFFSPVKMY